jgi:hypothetical protein
MHGTTPTVLIQTTPSEENPTGHVVINETDYDEATHTLVVDEPVKEVKLTKAEKTAAKEAEATTQAEADALAKLAELPQVSATDPKPWEAPAP